MDELTKSLSVTLNLTETECTIQTLHEPAPTNTPDSEIQPIPLFIVVKVHTVKSFNRKNFIEKMTKYWNNISRNPVTITDRSNGLFLVEFGCDGDRRRVLLQQPWTYLNQAILMDIPNSLDVLNGDSLLKIPLWVQVFNTPFLKRSEELAVLVSSSLGHLLEIYRPSLRETWGPYFRLRVMFDVAHPLPRGLPIHFSGINKVVWLELKYENLPDICFFCGRMGHSYNKGCMDYMKACDEAPFPPELRYDIKTIMGKVKVTTNALLCNEQLNFTNPPVASFMTSNPASAVCVAPRRTPLHFPPTALLSKAPPTVNPNKWAYTNPAPHPTFKTLLPWSNLMSMQTQTPLSKPSAPNPRPLTPHTLLSSMPQ
uniref:Zinc knuckle CX2CX4HX4C domain-containing protein n=1 Tax=Cannabis sativa TaxID=3483 RepID=A0A803Q8Z6_CANSA